jgi:hypothetical protein
MSLPTFTLFHVILSLIGIVAGAIVVAGMLGSKPLNGWVAIFLATTVLTSVTGFFFPSDKILPSHIVGILSLVVLAFAILGFYVYHFAGSWRWIYVVSSVVALYFNVFVGVVQAFGKVSFLHAQAPTQSEPPFIIAQAIVLLLFVALGFMALRSFHPAAGAPASRPG